MNLTDYRVRALELALQYMDQLAPATQKNRRDAVLELAGVFVTFIEYAEPQEAKPAGLSNPTRIVTRTSA